MKKEFPIRLFAGFAILALLAAQTNAQTQYKVSILPVPAPYLGGNGSSINDGNAAGSAYTDCRGQSGCLSLLVPMAWPTLGAAVDLTRNTSVGLSSAMQAVQPSDQALGVSGNTQVGWGAFLDRDTRQEFAHALLWHGAPNTLTDIHPAGYQNTQALAAAGNKQVGYAVNGNDPIAPGTYHGLLWFGTAASVIDLNQFLPPGYTDAQVDAIGPVTGIITGAAKGPKGVFEPAVWIPVAQ